jgi:hypothetical protein
VGTISQSYLCHLGKTRTNGRYRVAAAQNRQGDEATDSGRACGDAEPSIASRRCIALTFEAVGDDGVHAVHVGRLNKAKDMFVQDRRQGIKDVVVESTFS